MTTDANTKFLPFAANADAAYSTNNSATAPPVNGWSALKIERFRAESPDFAAQLYTDGAGHYRIGIRGSELSNFAGDFRRADTALAAGLWDPQLGDAIRFVGEAILQIKNSPAGKDLSFDEIRSAIDGSGHSLGGSLWELASKFYGLAGMNIDGPGIARQIQLGEFSSLKEEFRAKGMSELQDNYDLVPGQFQARRYTIVGVAQNHPSDVEVYTSPKMAGLIVEMESTPSWAYPLGAGHKFAWETLGSIAGHPMAMIYKAEGYTDPAQALAEQNVAAGRSFSGYFGGSTHLIATGNVVTVGSDANVEQRQSTIQITTYKDPITGAMMEAWLGGVLTNGTFVATPGQSFVSGMDIAGRVVYTGDVAQGVLQRLGADVAQFMGGDTRMSVQTHGDGQQSVEFKNDKGSTAYLLPAEQGSGKQLVISNPEGLPNGAGTAIFQFDGQFKQTGATYLDKQGTDISDEVEKLLQIFGVTTPAAGPGVHYADAGIGTGNVTDAGSGTDPERPPVPEPTPYNYTNYQSGAGAGLSPHQQAGLALQLDSLHLGGESALSFITLPGGGTTLIQNADGDIVGEIHQSTGNGANGSQGYVRLSGVRINADGSAEPYTAYIAANGQALTPEQHDHAQASDVAGAVGLMNSIIGLQHWDSMGELQRLAAVASIYNVVDKLGGGGSLPGDLGSAASALGLLSALNQGNAGGALYSGLSLVENLTATAGVANSGWVSLNMPGGGNFLPGLGLVLALDSGDPVSILAAAANFIPGYGQVISACITLLGSLLGDDDQPMLEGRAHAEWDAAGNTIVLTDQDQEGGGATATGWMQSLVANLQEQLAATTDAAGNSYALIPNLLPAIGYQYDPDGFNLANGAKGFLYLQWTDESGATQTRYYDGAGSRGDGSGETLAGDFMKQAQGAMAPAWQVQTVLAHWQQGGGIHLPEDQAGLPQAVGDGIQQSLQALSLALPGVPAQTQSLVDIDGDGYLERSQWLAANQQVLAIDANGDGRIGAGELLSLGGGTALNALVWLDANQDRLLDARDPGFSALRLWMDINSDGSSQGEARTLGQAGISAIDFGSSPPTVVHADGSLTALTAQTLLGDILGVSYQTVVGGVLQLDEQSNAAAIATLHAVNTRAFDGQAAHRHGGEAADIAPGSATSTVTTGDTRLVSTTANTLTTQSTQTSTVLILGDARIQSGAPGSVQAGQAEGSVVAGAPAQVSRPVTFIPAGPATAGNPAREATAAMVRSADGGLFGPGSSQTPLVALALGAAAIAQFPALASSAPLPGDVPAAGPPPEAGDLSGPISWQIWDGSRVSVATPLDAFAGSAGGVPVGGSASGVTTAGTTATWGDFHKSNSAPAQYGQAQTAIDFVANEAYANVANAYPEPFVPPLTASGAAGSASADGGMLVDFPHVRGEQAQAREDAGLRFLESLLLANDSTLNSPARPGEPSLRITSVFAPIHGSVSLQVQGGVTEVLFVPAANYHGPASFSYTVTDQYGLSSQASVSLQVTAVNDAPVTQDESASGDEDNTLVFTAASLLANDLDVDSAVDGDVLRITRVGQAEHGQVFLASDGTVRFVPDVNYNGPARFSYWVGDRDPALIASGEGYETSATVNLTILPVNDLPVVTGEVMDSDEDIVLDIPPSLLLANDSDVDMATNGQVLTISAVGNARHGAIMLLADGSLRFTPEADYFGAAGFSYTVDDGNGGQVVGQVVVNLAPVNDAPEVVGETLSFNEDEVQTITQAQLLANDSDVDNPHADLHIVAVDNATHGAVALNPDGSIRFVPAADYFGTAQFTYTVSDGVGGFTVGTASLDIVPVNDAPRLVGENAVLDEDTEARFSIAALLANDSDVDNAHADMVITEAAISATSAAHGSVQLVGGEIVFTPTLNFNGQASFTYTVSDGVGGSSQATVNLTFNPVNDAPVANSELLWGKRNVSYLLTQAALLANDTDVESVDALRVSAINNVQHGVAVLNADGSVRFTPEAGYSGRGSFDYVVQDPEGATSMATAAIDFSRINLTPVATDDSFIGYEDVTFSITQAQLLLNDADADNPASDLRVTAVAGAQNGSVSLDANGTVRFVPIANFYGTASFTYQVSDGDGGQTWAMAQLNVQSVNDAPVIEDIWYGRPIYGHAVQWATAYDESGTPYQVATAISITSEAQARALLAAGQLSGWSGSYYQNGQLRPIGFDYTDASSGDESGTLINDPYRQNGGVVAYDPDGNSALLSFSVGGTPQHGHAWANVYTVSSAPGSIDHTQAGAYWAGETGAWQYYSQRGDGYGGADPFTITVTDSGGAVAYAGINTAHVGSSISGGGGKKPVTLDLDGNGLHYIGLDDSQAYFDVNNDGWREHLAWVSAGDALLVRDIGADRVIDRFDEISFTSYLPGARTDLEGLAAFDSNGDGILSRLDARWQEFGAWQDANGDGRSDAEEFQTLDEIGIVQVGLTGDQQIRLVDGVIEFGQSSFLWSDGRSGAVGDVALPVGQALLAPAAPPTPEHMALLMAQMINTVTAAQDAVPLASIGPPDGEDPQQALLAEQARWESLAQSQATHTAGGNV